MTDTITTILGERGFHIKEWFQNASTGTNTQIDVNVRMPDSTLDETENALGLKWVVQNDKLKFNK